MRTGPSPRGVRISEPHAELSALIRFVQGLIRRERAVLSVRIFGLAGLVLAAAALIAVVAAWTGLDRAVASFTLVAGLGVGLWGAVFVPLWLGWRRAGDPLRQARLVERSRPDLQGRLITAVERPAGPVGAESPAILHLIAARALSGVRGLRPAAIHRAWPSALLGAPAVLGLLVALVLALISPQGLPGIVDYWSARDGRDAQLASADADGPDRARVGDLLIEYVYPAYTGLEPLEIPNSTGDVHGPPGTRVRVRARSAELVTAAAIFAYDQPTDATELSEGRLVRGEFTVGDTDGSWYIELQQGDSNRRSRSFAIEVEPDLEPVVIVDAPRRVEVPVDGLVELPWIARDDFGLSKIVLVIDGAEGRVLRELSPTEGETTGTVRFVPSELGLTTGSQVRIQVGAYDNNGWSGAQLGVSEPAVELTVGEPDTLRALSLEQRQELRAVLVDLLAAQLMEPWPPQRTSAGVMTAGERFDGLYAPLRAYRQEHPELYRDRLIRRLLGTVERAGIDFVTYTQINFDPSQARAGVQLELLASAGDLRDDAVIANEQAIIILDRYLSRDALSEVVTQAGQLASLGRRLEGMIERDASRGDLLLASERVQRATEELQTQAERLSGGSLRDLVDRRVREFDAVRGSLEEELRDEASDRARPIAGRLARMLDELHDELEYRLRRLDDEDDELSEELASLIDELKQVEREQRQMQQQVREVRESSDAQGAAQAERRWAEVERLAGQAAEQGQGVLDRMPTDGIAFYAREYVAVALRTTERLEQTARARDLRKALTDVDEALGGWMRVQRVADEGGRRAVVTRLEQAQRILQQLAIEANSVDPATAGQVRGMQDQQSALASKRDELEQKARQLIPQLPIEPIGMLDALENAKTAMSDAGTELRRGRPMPAEGVQGQAAEQVKEARHALEDVLQQMGGGGGGEGESGGEGGEESDDGRGDLDLDAGAMLDSRELNLDDEFDLDAFQRDVLRGMQGDVPESYRALKKRYYEELMTQ